MLKRDYPDQVCSIARSLEVVGERWSLLILRDAVVGLRRFEDFQHSLGIASNTLTDRLRLLCDEGVLDRVPDPDRPGRPMYILTDKGRELAPALIILMKWGDRHYPSPGGPPRLTLHASCGGSVGADLRCERCGQRVGFAELDLRPGIYGVMSGTAPLLGIAVVALGMALTPGPNMMYLVSRSIGQGRRAGMISLLGTLLGFLVYMTMANIGLASVFIVVPALYIAVKAAGAAYLLWLAWKALRPGAIGVFEMSRPSPDSGWKLFRSGLLTNLLNPKAAIMYLAIIPQFVRPSAGNVLLQGFSLGGVQIAVSMAVNSGLIIAASAVASFLSARPRWTVWQRRITGTLLGAFGVKLATEVPLRARV